MKAKYTPQEKEVVKYLLLGKPDREIGELLGITVRTVKGHMSRLFNKFEIDSKRCYARVALVVQIFYENYPDFVPFNDGDRAAMLGFPSATDFNKSKSKEPTKPIEPKRRRRKRGSQYREPDQWRGAAV